jgi:HK97 family phage major capsid protein
MANAIPLLEGTNASGGYLVPDEIGQTLTNTIKREGAIADLARVDRLVGKRTNYPVYAGRPTAAFVAEGAPKPATGAEYSQTVLNVKKIATTVMYTEELLEDAREDPRVLVNADVESAFADLIDAHGLGWQAGSAITTSFDSAVGATTQTTEYDQTKADGLALAVSAAMNTIESNGGTPSGLVLASDARATFRNARQSGSGLGAAQPVFTNGFEREPDTLYGLRVRYSSNLPTVAGTAAASRVIGVVGDFSHAILGIRKDITVRTTNTATIDVSGTLHHLFQQNKVAALWEMRVGFVAHDLNRMFVAILNAA